MTVILGCVDDLAALVPKGQADGEMAELQRRVEQASQLTHELLATARPRPAAPYSVDLNDVIGPVVETLSRKYGDRIRLRLHMSAEPVRVLAQPGDLERILLNLALNGIEAMSGTGMLTIQTAVIGPHARLIVIDTGSGMSPEVKSHMFEPFFTTKPTGTGLGLSSVAFSVRRLHGVVSVDSEQGRGTTITVIFPLADEHQSER
jgi:two-component system, cell cycle sensor histidine kinase and response regulator CckA